FTQDSFDWRAALDRLAGDAVPAPRRADPLVRLERPDRDFAADADVPVERRDRDLGVVPSASFAGAAWGALFGFGGLGTAMPFHAGICPSAMGSGFCAACGWSGPAYTASFEIICRPSRVFGSIPRMAFSTTSVGRSARSFVYRCSRIPPGY